MNTHATGDEAVRERQALYFEIFAASLAAILLEVSYTRIFSFKLYYYFTYLVIGLALVGLGAGSVVVTLVARVRAARLSVIVTLFAAIASATTTSGYFVVALVQLDPTQLHKSVLELGKLAILCLALFVPFLCVGVMISRILGARPDRIPRLYFADLMGAGLGCALVIPLIWAITPPGCVMASAFLFGTAGLRLASVRSRLAIAGLVVVAGLGVSHASKLPDPIPEPRKTLGKYDPRATPIVFSEWSPVFRVDVIDVPWNRSVKWIMHDGHIGSGLHRFDGDVATLSSFKHDARAFPFAIVGPKARVLVIGAAGGHEILASLYFDVAHVTGVELNPVTVSLLTDHFADYSGRLAQNPRVTLVNGEGRSYLKRHGGDYDMIWLVAPDTYAAMNAASSASYVLSEGYLYTVEMIIESLAHLGTDGVLCAQFGEVDYIKKPNRTSRYLATAREALRRVGITDFGKHVAVITTPDMLSTSTVILKRSELSDVDVAKLREALGEVSRASPRYVPGFHSDGDQVTDVITLSEAALQASYARRPYLVDPVTDNSPFFWHFARFGDAVRSARSRGIVLDSEDSAGERVLLVLLVFVVVFAATMLLLPFQVLGEEWRNVPYKGWAALYFASLGLGFMFFEVPLIQMLTLFLGYPSYSLSVTLFALLLSTAIGSVVSPLYPRVSYTWIALVVGLGGCVGFYRFLWPDVMAWAIGFELPFRIVTAVVVIMPLGIILGAFMPLGLTRVAQASAYSREYVAWAWAVNGFFSVISSVLSSMLAMSAGFNNILLGALCCYGVAGVAISRIRSVP